jgi:DNA topoisomerase-1
MDEKCPKCEKPLATRLGRNGLFIGCTGYPECDYTRNVNDDQPEEQLQIVEDRECPKCQGKLQIRVGRYGKFIGCSNYPKCNFIEPLEKPRDTHVQCPQCKKGTLLQRRSKKGKFFFSCSTYPSCSYAIWNEPIAESCPNCHWPVMMIKVTKKNGREKACPQKDCHYSEQLPDEEMVS